jgi:hypothetical protein
MAATLNILYQKLKGRRRIMFPLLLIPYYLLVGTAGAFFISRKTTDTKEYKTKE